ncbi:MAG: hypothetical protein JO333_07755 [Verrucomicrobia bacterium]|nr:hypothetical protein [Verrucomicrobiota bacterium]
MNYIIKSLSHNKYCLRAVIIVPVLGILAFTPYSSTAGTTDRQSPRKHWVVSYWQQRQSKHRLPIRWQQSLEKPRVPDRDPYPGYDWFY